jgi:putative ABC transport system permease protein
MRSWLVALRIARREARRAKGRTALIIAMIALPVFALAFAATTFDMQRLTPHERVERLMGSADGIVYHTGNTTDQEDEQFAATQMLTGSDDHPHEPATILPLLPSGSTATGVQFGAVTVDTASGVAGVSAYALDANSPITRGLVYIFHGRAPRAANEVALSPNAMAHIGVRVGQRVAIHPGGSLIVVGVAEVGGRIDDSMLFAPTAALPSMTGYWLIQQPSPLLIDEIHRLNAAGYQAQSRAYFLNPPLTLLGTGSSEVVAGLSTFSVGTIVAGLGLLEVVLLAGPAFAVGARRRQRDLALIATNGGTPSVLRRIVLADGIVCGGAAAILGIVAGIGLALGVRGLLEAHLWHARFGADRVSPLWLTGIAGVAIVTGLLGALVPAFTAARQEIVLALAGRRGIQRSRLRWAFVGVSLIVLGAVGATYGAYTHTANTVLAGLVAGEFGIVLCTPTIVGWVARLGRFLPLTPRIALRDASRRRAAAAPAISAVMAAVAGSIALTVYLGASEQGGSTYRPSAPIGTAFMAANPPPSADGRATIQTAAQQAAATNGLRTSLLSVFPGTHPIAFTRLGCIGESGCNVPLVLPDDHQCPYSAGPDLSRADQKRARADARCDNSSTFSNGDGSQIVTDDPTLVATVTGLSGARLDAAVSTLRHGGVLTADASYVEHGHGTVTAADEADVGGTGVGSPILPITVPAFVTPMGGSSEEPILSPALAAKLHRPVTAIGLVVRLPDVPTRAQQDRLQKAIGNVGGSLYIETGNPTRPSPIPLMLAIAAGIIALGAAGIATGLAAADSRHDLTTLAAVGATPRVRRSLSLAQSGIIAGLGALLGSIAGFGAAAAILSGINAQWADTWPGPQLFRISVPWTNFGISLVIVPVVAMAAAGLLTRSRLPSERRTG